MTSESAHSMGFTVFGTVSGSGARWLPLLVSHSVLSLQNPVSNIDSKGRFGMWILMVPTLKFTFSQYSVKSNEL